MTDMTSSSLALSLSLFLLKQTSTQARKRTNKQVNLIAATCRCTSNHVYVSRLQICLLVAILVQENSNCVLLILSVQLVLGVMAEMRRIKTIVVYSHHAIDENELELNIGEIVYVTQMEDSGWWQGHHLNGLVLGWFPYWCVRPCRPRSNMCCVQ